MAITLDEERKYQQFVLEQVAALKTLQIDVDEVIWHYTTGTALLNIIETGTLYATQVSCLNDSTEVSYAGDLLHSAGVRLGAGNLSPEQRQAVELLLRATVDGRLASAASPINSTASSWWFVTCFSSERDDLSQWRAYGTGENGYAIGFRAGALFRQDNYVARVNYDAEQQEAVAARIAEASLRFFMEGLQNGRSDSAIEWANEFFPDWERRIGQLSPMIKDPAFRAEKEVRAVHRLRDHELPKLRFSQKNALMARHLPLSFPPPPVPDSKMLPIVEVLVGPSRHMEVSRVSVDTFMRQRHYDVPVTKSRIPFQMT